MNIHLRTAAGASALALALTACSATEADPTTDAADGGSSPTAEPTVLELAIDPKDSEQERLDVGSKGDSVGDRSLAATTLRQDGKVAGRLQGDCVTLDNAYEGHLCSMVVLVEGGSLTLVGGGTHEPIGTIEPAGDVFAVTGGTGDHAGAAGEAAVSQDGQTLTITLLP